MSEHQISLEATTAIKTREIIESHVGVAAFIETLDSEQRRRFTELSHHIYHEGVEDGLSRGKGDITVGQQVRILIHDAEIFTLGAATYQSELGEGG